MVHELRCVAAGQIMRGCRNQPSAEMHSIAVTSVRFTVVPRCFLKSSLLTSTLRELSTLRRNSYLVHVINILRENVRIGQLSTNDGKPVLEFVLDLPAISLLIDLSQPSRFQLRMSSIKALRPISRRPNLEAGVCDLENRRPLAHDDQGERS